MKSTVTLQNLDEVPECTYRVRANESRTVVVFSTGSKSIDGTVHVHLTGNNAQAYIYGVFVISGNNIVKLHTLQSHEAFGTMSNLLVKSVVMDQAVFSYDGAIRVEKQGQKTDAYQRNENLVLSQKAHARSKPSLEILADDVRCTHGATIGTIDTEQLFYLASRGVSYEIGKQLIVEGFLNGVLSKISDTMKAKTVWQSLSKQLQ